MIRPGADTEARILPPHPTLGCHVTSLLAKAVGDKEVRLADLVRLRTLEVLERSIRRREVDDSGSDD